MDMLGSIARIDPGSAVTRRSSGSVVPASNPPAGNSGDDSDQRGSATVAKQAVAAPPPAKPPVQRQSAPPPAVVLDGFYDRRISDGPNGLTIDLVYKNTGLRAARLVGRSSSTVAESEGEGEQAVAAGTAARAYRTARGGVLATTTQLTG
jgi:hypothetical protein